MYMTNPVRRTAYLRVLFSSKQSPVSTTRLTKGVISKRPPFRSKTLKGNVNRRGRYTAGIEGVFMRGSEEPLSYMQLGE